MLQYSVVNLLKENCKINMVPSSREPKETPAAAIKTLSQYYHCHFYTKHAFFIVLRQDSYFNVYTSFVDTGNPSSLVPITSIVPSSEFVWSNKKNHFEIRWQFQYKIFECSD